MSSIMNSQSLALATAMAISGSLILVALCRQKSLSTGGVFVDQDSKSNPQTLRSCMSSDKKRREKKKKKVHFADDVVDQDGNGLESRKKFSKSLRYNQACKSEGRGVSSMPTNRTALYHGILRDRVHRMACSY
ncbi:hypothetical protein BVC80_8641g11 [Macleaya cordata]|uniref:Transmembrane protein n=1 Tax=Macleaya cordata TaxID=56857 RepID=A0A200QBF6_MACCD|nr:hypothetical protein BVC80_8641g11 [Macleaya cordata]